MDTKGKGTLDYGEFVAVSLHLQKVANDEHLRKAFSYFDKDGNGHILPQELCDALKEDGGDDCVDVANDIFQEVDTDKVSFKSSINGLISCSKDLSFARLSGNQSFEGSVILNLFLRYLFDVKPFEITVLQIDNGELYMLCKRFLKPVRRTKTCYSFKHLFVLFFRLCPLCKRSP